MAAMKSSLTITKRKVKNIKTGIDMNVPSYAQADSPRNVKYFHVVVISTLPHFKSEEHSEEDTVQFMVQRDYEAFEKLQKELVQQYPELKIPMPRKYYLFMSEEDLEDRRVSFDCLLTVVANNKELCTSIPVLIFLGIDLLADRKYAKRRKEYLQKQNEQSEESKKEEEEVVDLFSQHKSQEQKNNVESDEDLFSGSPDHTKKAINESVSVKVSLLADELEYQDALYLAEQNGEEKNNQTYEEDSELKQLTESLNDDLVIPVAKQKDKKPVLNQETKKKVRDLLFEDDDEDASKGASIMTTNDVMDYLKKNVDNNDDDDLSLF